MLLKFGDEIMSITASDTIIASRSVSRLAKSHIIISSDLTASTI